MSEYEDVASIPKLMREVAATRERNAARIAALRSFKRSLKYSKTSSVKNFTNCEISMDSEEWEWISLSKASRKKFRKFLNLYYYNGKTIAIPPSLRPIREQYDDSVDKPWMISGPMFNQMMTRVDEAIDRLLNPWLSTGS
jgi:protein-tyrosine-phosphatase